MKFDTALLILVSKASARGTAKDLIWNNVPGYINGTFHTGFRIGEAVYFTSNFVYHKFQVSLDEQSNNLSLTSSKATNSKTKWKVLLFLLLPICSLCILSICYSSYVPFRFMNVSDT